MVEILQDFKPFFGIKQTGIPDVGALHYLQKLGVIDIGSNSVRMVVFDGAARSPSYFYNEKILCGLGLGLISSGKLNEEGKMRAISAIERFVNIAEAMEVPQLTLIATAAVRMASDGQAFCKEI
ncbi:MAG: exopolyphosphatase, partial [Paracoccaceae bacterium]